MVLQTVASTAELLSVYSAPPMDRTYALRTTWKDGCRKVSSRSLGLKPPGQKPGEVVAGLAVSAAALCR
jgi:hypothetical protein